MFWSSRPRKKRLLSSISGEGSFSSEVLPFIRLPYVTVVWLYFIMSHLMTKPTKWSVRSAKTQISLGVRPGWSESSLSAQLVAKGPSFLHADSECSDQTGWMPRLIWAFAWHTCHFVGFVIRRLISYQNLSESLAQHGYCSTYIKTVYVYVHLKYTDQNK